MPFRRLAAVASSAALLFFLSPSHAVAAGNGPWFGVLNADGSHGAQEASAHLSVASLELNWGAYEPSPGVFDQSYVAREQAKLSSLRSAGLQVTLDPGLQYPPSWVFSLDGNTRFVDQYGDVWHGPQSQDVANAVFDPSVRAAMSPYIARIAADFGDVFYAIRAGGVLQDELRYPPQGYNGHGNLYWAFDANAQAHSPVPGYVPGQPDQNRASAFLDYYLVSLSGYESWLLQQYRSHFGAWLQMVMPSWGLRPGDAAAAAAANLDGSTPAAGWGTLSMGLDWQRQIAGVPDQHVQLYSTWAERGDDGGTANSMAPAHWLASLGAARGLPAVAENASSSSSPSAVVANARAWGLAGLMWCNERDLAGGTTPGGFDALANAIASGPYSSAAPGSTPVEVQARGAQNGSYWMTTTAGQVLAFGNHWHGDLYGSHLNQPIVGMAATPSGGGYWLVASDGGIFPFGDAAGYGSTGGIRLNQPIVGMAATPSGHGYWLVARDGGIFPFGDAVGYGSTGGIRLNQPIVGMAATAGGQGYWLVARDGGIFPFGDAGGYGSTGSVHLNRPIVGMSPTSSGHGYWLVASDGGMFPLGDAGGYGSTGGIRLNQPIAGMASSPTGHGYWLIAADGGVFPFGDAAGIGSGAGLTHGLQVVAVAR